MISVNKLGKLSEQLVRGLGEAPNLHDLGADPGILIEGCHAGGISINKVDTSAVADCQRQNKWGFSVGWSCVGDLEHSCS